MGQPVSHFLGKLNDSDHLSSARIMGGWRRICPFERELAGGHSNGS
jgi:hypothetical protein